MRKIIVLGASALVLALGVAQASASAPYYDQSPATYYAGLSAQPAYTGELRDFRGQTLDQNAWQGGHFSEFDANDRHSTSH